MMQTAFLINMLGILIKQLVVNVTIGQAVLFSDIQNQILLMKMEFFIINVVK
jgi:hypothetical protein